MNNWVPKSKLVKFATIVAVLSVLLYFAGLWVVSSEINKIENLYHDANSELFKEEKFWAVKSVAEANKESIQTLRDFFVQKGDEVKFIEQIEKVAETASVKYEITSIEVKASQKIPFKEDVNIKIRIAGSWKNSILFIDELNKMPFGVSLVSADLDVGSSANWSGLIEFIIFREK